MWYILPATQSFEEARKVVKYAIAYCILLVTLVAISGSIMYQYGEADAVVTAPYYEAMPVATFEELYAKRTELVKEAFSATDPNTYYTVFLPAARRLSTIAQANIRRAPERTMDIMRLERIVTSNHNVISQVQQGYFERFTQRRIVELSPRDMKEEGPSHESLGPYWLRWYLITLMLAAVFFVVRIKEKGLALWVETLQPHQLLLAIAGWPLFMWRYPGDTTPSQQMRGALRYATLVLGTLLSGGVASAKAENGSSSTSKKQDPKRKWALVVRAIASRQVSEGPPNNEGGFRWHLIAPSGTFLEEASTFRKDFSSHTPIVGQMLWRQGPSTAAVIAGGTFTSTGSRSAFAGTEVVITKPRWQVAMPLCLVERQTVPKPATSFALLVQAVVKHGKWAAGPEVSLRASPGRRPTWAVGGVITYGWGKGKPTLENGLFRSNTGALRARTRLINAFSF